jgi:hypothetical protein
MMMYENLVELREANKLVPEVPYRERQKCCHCGIEKDAAPGFLLEWWRNGAGEGYQVWGCYELHNK